MEEKFYRFNPCFNGTYSLTGDMYTLPKEEIACFNPCFNGTYSLTIVLQVNSSSSMDVLILVLMELTL